MSGYSPNTEDRKYLFRRQRGRCFYCQRDMHIEPQDRLHHYDRMCTVDHVIPRSEGGPNHRSNYVGACHQCNNARGVIPHELFARYARRFGPAYAGRMHVSNWYLRRNLPKAGYAMRDAGLSDEFIYDTLCVKLSEALAKRSAG